MKLLLYLLTLLFGIFGVLAALRVVERVTTGAGLLPAQVLVSLVLLVLAGICFRRTRNPG